MEKRSFTQWDSSVDETEEEIEEVSIQVKQQPPASICLRSQFPDRVIVIGRISGNRYEFNRGGSELMVDERDVPTMLEKRFGGHSCCGSNVGPLPYFIVI